MPPDIREKLAFPPDKKISRVVFCYLVFSVFLLLFIKFAGARAFRDFADFAISFLPMLVIAIMAVLAFVRSRQHPEDIRQIHDSALKNTLYLLVITLLFYILYAPASFAPILQTLKKSGRLLTMENIFLLFAGAGILLIGWTAAYLAVRYRRRQRGTFKVPYAQTVKHSLYGLFFIFLFMFASSAAAYPQAYKPLTDTLGDIVYTVSYGQVRVFKDDLQTFKQIKSAKDLARSAGAALSDARGSLSRSISDTGRNLAADLSDTKTELGQSIAQSSADLKDTLSSDIKEKLDLNGGVLSGGLEIEGELTVNDTAKLQDGLPQSDNVYDLGSLSKGWHALYAGILYGANGGLVVGNGSSSHSLDNSGDLLVSGHLEANETAYLDGGADLNNQTIANLADPVNSRDAATKNYADNLVGAAAFISRTGTTIYPTNSGDGLDMLAGLILNIGNAGTDFTSAGGLNLAENLILAGTVDSGLGATEIYLMDQNVQTADSPTFAGLALNGALTTGNNGIDGTNYDISAAGVITGGTWNGAVIADGYIANDITLTNLTQITNRDHGSLQGLSDDDHTQYALLAGRSGGQILIGGTGTTDDLTLQTTSGVGATGADMHFKVGNNGATEAMTILNTGNVGIGTTGPGAPLDILGAAGGNIGGNLRIYSTQSQTVGSGGAIEFGGKYTTAGGYTYSGLIQTVKESAVSGEYGFGMAFGTRINGGANTEKVRITSQGNVGIGTTSPGQLLTVGAGSVGKVDIAGNSAGVSLTRYDTADPYLQFILNGGQTYTLGIDNSVNDVFGIWGDGSIGNNPRLIIDTTGKVGIGTTSPGNNLSISGTNPANIPALGANGGQFGFFNGGFSYGLLGGVLDTGNSYLQAQRIDGTATAYNLLLQANGGNVGIGTTGPNVPLHIAGSGATTLNLFRLENTNTGAASEVSQLFTVGSSVDRAKLMATREASGLGGDFNIFTADTSNVLQNRLTINYQGNVGIGTTGPAEKLEIAGGRLRLPEVSEPTTPTLNFGGDTGFYSTSNDLGLSTAGEMRWHFTGDMIYPKIGGGATLKSSATSATVPVFMFANDEDTGLASAGDNIVSLVAGGTNVLNVTSGNVGIGTTGPNSKLSVAGNLSVGNTAAGTSGTRVLVLENGTIPSASPLDSIQLYAEDAAASSELKVRDEAGNITTLSPHNFSIIPAGPSEDLAWSFYSQRKNLAINVDMAKTVRLVEQLSGQQLIYLKDLKSGSYDESEPNMETPLAIKTLEEQKINLAGLALQTSENVTTLEELKKLLDENTKTLDKKIKAVNSDISGLSDRMDKIEKQMEELKLLSNQELNIARIEANKTDISYLKTLLGTERVKNPGDIDILGKIKAEDIEALGIVKAKNIEVENSLKGKMLMLSNETTGKGKIKAGETETEIKTPYASESVKISITPKGDAFDRVLFYDDVKERESFKVKIKKPADEGDINFDWLIIR